MTQQTDDERVAPLDEADRLSTAPDQSRVIAVPRLGSLGLLRWCWRQLTSMRIALSLLFLLSLAAIPGSLLPQNEIDPSKVLQFYVAHKTWAPILDDLQLFDVFESVWFGAIYTLLFISLVGCIVPRTYAHFKSMRATPPAAPRNLRRLPVHASFTAKGEAEEVLAEAARLLKRRRFRTVTGKDLPHQDDGARPTSAPAASGGVASSRVASDWVASGWVASDKGFLRETGNLLFHLALLGILVAVSIGHFFGFKGAVLVTQGSGFADTVAGYDTLTMGQAVGPADLPPFQIMVNRFDASYQTTGDQYGQPRSFNAYVTYKAGPTGPPVNADLQVNEPLTFNGTRIYLLGHGYSPIVTVKDGEGEVVFSGPVTFLGIDAMFDSSGAIKVPDAKPQGLGFEGDLLPTAYQAPGQAPASIFPSLGNPVLILSAYAGSLNMNGGESQSVYTLDTSQMKQLDVRPRGEPNAANAIELAQGKTATLPNGLGSITFDGVDQWVQLDIAYDPGQSLALASAALAVLGLLGSLFIKRRRVWARVTPQAGGALLVEVAGLARTESATPTAEVTALAEALAAGLKRAFDPDFALPQFSGMEAVSAQLTLPAKRLSSEHGRLSGTASYRASAAVSDRRPGDADQPFCPRNRDQTPAKGVAAPSGDVEADANSTEGAAIETAQPPAAAPLTAPKAATAPTTPGVDATAPPDAGPAADPSTPAQTLPASRIEGRP